MKPSKPRTESITEIDGIRFEAVTTSGKAGGLKGETAQSGLTLTTRLTIATVQCVGFQPPVPGYIYEACLGLRRSLVLAGSETQVMTLWAVDDEATRYFMASYYEKLKAGSDRAAALRQAQLDFLNNNNSMYHHSAAWAAFTLTGNWRSLSK